MPQRADTASRAEQKASLNPGESVAYPIGQKTALVSGPGGTGLNSPARNAYLLLCFISSFPGLFLLKKDSILEL